MKKRLRNPDSEIQISKSKCLLVKTNKDEYSAKEDYKNLRRKDTHELNGPDNKVFNRMVEIETRNAQLVNAVYKYGQQNMELKGKLEESENTHKLKDNEFSKLSSQINILKEKDMEIERLKTDNIKEASLKEQFKFQTDSLNKDLVLLKDQLQQLHNLSFQGDALKSEVHDLNDLVENYKQMLESKNSEFFEISSELATFREKCNTFEMENKKLQLDLQQMGNNKEQMVKSKQSEIETLRNEIDFLKELKSNTESQLETAKGKIHNQEDEIFNLKNGKEHNMYDALRQIESLNHELDALKKDKSFMSNELAGATSKIENLYGDMQFQKSENEKYTNKFIEVQLENDVKNKEIQDLTKENHSLDEELQRMVENFNNKAGLDEIDRQRFQEVQMALQGYVLGHVITDDHSRLRENYNRATEELEKHRKQLGEADKLISGYQSQAILKQNDELNNLVNHKEKITKELESQKTHNGLLESTLVERKNTIGDLHNEKSSAQEELSKLQERMSKQQKLISQQQTKITELKDNVNEQENKITDLKQNLNQKTQEIEQLYEELDSYKQKAQDADNWVLEANQKIQDLHNENDNLKKSEATFVPDFSQYSPAKTVAEDDAEKRLIKSLREKIKKLTNENKAMMNEMESMQKKFNVDKKIPKKDVKGKSVVSQY